MKGFIEVLQKDGHKTLVAIKDIKIVEEFEKYVAIFLDLSTTKKQIVNGYLLVSETFSEVLAKIKAAQEKSPPDRTPSGGGKNI